MTEPEEPTMPPPPAIGATPRRRQPGKPTVLEVDPPGSQITWAVHLDHARTTVSRHGALLIRGPQTRRHH
jgi:hypothetical protein